MKIVTIRASSVRKLQQKKPMIRLRVLTKAVCENVISTIENRIRMLSFIDKIEISNIFTSIIKKFK